MQNSANILENVGIQRWEKQRLEHSCPGALTHLEKPGSGDPGSEGQKTKPRTASRRDLVGNPPREAGTPRNNIQRARVGYSHSHQGRQGQPTREGVLEELREWSQGHTRGPGTLTPRRGLRNPTLGT